MTIEEGTDKEKEEHVSVLENIGMGPSPEVTSGTSNLTIDTSALADRSKSSPTVNQNSVLPAVQPPSTSTTVATATATSRSSPTPQEAPLSIIIVHFDGCRRQGGSSRRHILTPTSTRRGGDEYRDAMQHHEQFRRAVLELAIPVREVCSLMPVLNAMCCIVEDPSGLWKLAQVPVVRHLWKGGLAGIPSREASSAVAKVQSALASLSSSSSSASSPQHQVHVDSTDGARDDKADDVCVGKQHESAFSLSSSTSPSCTALSVSPRSLPRTSPVGQGREEVKERVRVSWTEVSMDIVPQEHSEKIVKEGGQGGMSVPLVTSDWQKDQQ
ncbi:hypothetical protein BG003_001407 [Podila horticola]|nr:hypothetical protein BG003_001407 [Podila horticola]